MKRKVVVLVFVALILVSNLIRISVPVKGFSDTNLVGYWRFDEGSGTIANDSSGNNNHGTLANMDPATSWVDGKYGKALGFDGVDDYVDVPDADSLDIYQNITIDVWIKPDVNDKLMNIVAKWAPEPDLRSYVLNIGNLATHQVPETGTDPGKIAFTITPDGYTNQYIVSDTIIPTNTWTHVVATYDRLYMKIYLNGTLDASKAQTGNIFIGTARLFVGYAERSNPTETYFDGIIDEMRIYNRALSQEEIQTPVGGIYISVNKLALLAPYIGLTILLAVVVMTVAYAKKRKRDAGIIS